MFGITGAPGIDDAAAASLNDSLHRHRQNIHLLINVEADSSVCRERLEPVVGEQWSEVVKRWTDGRAKKDPVEALSRLCTVTFDGQKPITALVARASAVLQWEHLSGNNFKQLESQDPSSAGAEGDAALHVATVAGDADPNAFAITLFCVDETFESRSRDFLVAAFAAFPDREYCILTLPHDSNETALLQHFTQVPPSPTNTFSHVLYIVQRASLLAPRNFTVRQANFTDRAGILRLLQGTLACCVAAVLPGEGLTWLGAGMPESTSIMREIGEAEEEAETRALEENPTTAAFVGLVQDQVVGVAILTTAFTSSKHMDTMVASFDLDRLVQLKYHPYSNCSSLLHFSVNPIFQQHSRYFLRRACQLYRKTAVFYRLASECAAPTVIDEFIQVLPALQPHTH